MSPSSPRPTAWPALLALFCFVLFVEGVGISHVLAFAPLYLQQLGAEDWQVPLLTGVVSAGAFVVGLPLVPFWGVWAEKYGRKLIIVRSACVEGLVFLLVGLSRGPLELVGSTLLSGFQLGNGGVMYAALVSVAPRERTGFALAVMGVASPLGFALGPAVGGLVADSVGLRPLYLADAGLSLLSALALVVFLREARPAAPPPTSAWRMAWDAVRGIALGPLIRMLFLAYTLVFLARFIASPFLPLLVQSLYAGENPATVVGLVVGGTAVAGALLSPMAGALGDRLGYARVLGWAAALGAGSAVALGLAPALWLLALAAVLFGTALTSMSAMCVALIATTTAAERRSSTLNLALLPLYFGGTAGAALGAALASIGVRMVFFAAAVPFVADALLARRLRPGREPRTDRGRE